MGSATHGNLSRKVHSRNCKGRSRRHDRFVALSAWVQPIEAWQSLSAARQALYIELIRRYNGLNKREISMSVC